FARLRSRSCRMGKADRQRARYFRFVPDDHATFPQGSAARTSLLGPELRRIENDERPGATLSVLFCRKRPSEIARRAGDDCSGRQKISPRNARRDPSTIAHRIVIVISKRLYGSVTLPIAWPDSI